ncbi:MAG: DUF1501 domain-containing protein [Flavobacteriales bacterium]|nr:DUF1501 domain-containing protein [Flavobacteriales bacterium]
MGKKNFSRRDFMKLSSMASLPLTLGGFPLFTHGKPPAPFDTENDKILVLVQLQGGNDGLSTLFHADEYANLAAVRSNILVPESSIINFTGDYGFHPVMTGMHDVWDMGAMGIVQNVGYPNQNRSHFRSTDIWNTASSAEQYLTTGWIGRFYDIEYSSYPNGFPNGANPHPFALTIGNLISETCQGTNANYSMAVSDPFNPGSVLIGAGGNTPANCYGDALSFVNQTAEQTNAYSTVISAAAGAGNNLSPKWANLETELAEKLKHVSRLISGGLQTKVYIVQIGGFDTHDNQVIDGAPETGNHAELLKELSDAVCAFQDDVELLGVDDRVVGMTYSEFGRRIRSNAGLGTDHGTAAPLFLFGSCIEPQILGDHPEIDQGVSIDEGIAMQYDFRDIYGTMLTHWLGADEQEVQNIIYPDFQALPLFKASCALVADVVEERQFNLSLYPNPTADFSQLEFSGNGEKTKIILLNAAGGLVKEIANQPFLEGQHSVNIDLSDLASGNYFLRISSKGLNRVEKLMRR